MYQSSQITIQNDMEAIDPVIAYLRVVATLLQLNEKEQYRICYALEESLQNSILFGFEKDDVQSLHVSINRIASGIEVIINDDGIPRDPFIAAPKSIKEIADETSFEEIALSSGDQISALSDFVIHKLLDRYRYINLGKEGRSIEMVLYASKGRISEAHESREIDDNEDRFSQIRFASAEDSTGISRLFYKSYGYSYVNDAVYYPERLSTLIETGALISAVARSEKNSVIGHIALMQPYSDAKITEWGMAISDPLFRGQGIMSKLIETIMQRALDSEYVGIFSHSVTNHAFTQKICTAHNFSDVALLVGYAGKELSFKKIHQELTQRESTIISFKSLKLESELSLYLPPKHAKMISKLYKGIGTTLIAPPPMKKDTKAIKSELSDTIISAVNIAEIVLRRIGDNVIDQLERTTKRLCIAKIDIIYLFIDMSDQRSASLIEKVETLGYFFGGIFPHYHHEHTLVMQYVNNLSFDYEKIISYTPLATELKAYIAARDPNLRT
ncbi:MAG: GNAT family N-acetyltransferase [Campylobacterota bacterium]|nr:GNAT family N-acetyltransferase [Campylobacterota bacterium]